MDDQKSNFFEPGGPGIVVREFTEEIITEVLEAYAVDNGFWLKLDHFARQIDISVFDELKAKGEKERIESEELQL
jgi:hypothetical protein